MKIKIVFYIQNTYPISAIKRYYALHSKYRINVIYITLYIELIISVVNIALYKKKIRNHFNINNTTYKKYITKSKKVRNG